MTMETFEIADLDPGERLTRAAGSSDTPRTAVPRTATTHREST